MQAFCITGGTKDQRLAYITQELDKRKIQPFNIHRLQKDPDVASIGIRDVKNWWKEMNYTPTGNAISAGIIESAELLTTEAQNALLKPLEEPPDFTVIFLESPTTGAILPTILSRCLLIQLKQEAYQEHDTARIENLLQTIMDPAKTVGEKMREMDREVPNKDSAKMTVLALFDLAHKNGPKNDPARYKIVMQALLTALQELQSNVSYKLILDALFLPEIH